MSCESISFKYARLKLTAAAAGLLLAGFWFTPCVFGQAKTTITDVLHAPDGALLNGQIVISSPSTFTAADGTIVFEGTVATAAVKNGSFSVALVPNAGSVPSGTSYRAVYTVGGSYQMEIWIVPYSASPVDLATVRSVAIASPVQMVSPTQLPAFSGDTTTVAGSTVTTTSRVNGVSYPSHPSVDTLPLVVTSDVVGYVAIPSCTDAGGQHLNIDTTTNPPTFSCGTSSSASLAVETNGVANASQGTLNLSTSTANAVGLTLTPTYSTGGVERFEISGGSYTGNAATATALASVPTNCGAGVAATGVGANGNAVGCFTPSGATWPLTSPSGATIASNSGDLEFTAGGTNQNITLTPSGTGYLHVTSGGLHIDGGGGSAVVAGNGSNELTVVGGFATFSGHGVISNIYATPTNCASAASPAVCGSAAAGHFVIPAGATTVTVNTTAVTANSEILINEDQSLGAALSVTCNTGISSVPAVSARVAGTSFSVVISASLATNPVCYDYSIIN